MLDRDLAALYGVTTSALKQSVRRNSERFPNDFMFVLNKSEFENWRSQIVISNSDRMGIRYPPMAFTEQGVAMLSSVLRSQRAVAVNIQIMRTFVRLRQMLASNAELAKKLDDLEKKHRGTGQRSEDRRQKTEDRSQEAGGRSQEAGGRSQEAGGRSQRSEVRSLPRRCASSAPYFFSAFGRNPIGLGEGDVGGVMSSRIASKTILN